MWFSKEENKRWCKVYRYIHTLKENYSTADDLLFERSKIETKVENQYLKTDSDYWPLNHHHHKRRKLNHISQMLSLHLIHYYFNTITILTFILIYFCLTTLISWRPSLLSQPKWAPVIWNQSNAAIAANVTEGHTGRVCPFCTLLF